HPVLPSFPTRRSSDLAVSSEDLELNRFAVAGGRHLEQRAERLGDATVAADDFAHVVLGDVQLDHGRVLLADNFDLHGIRVVHERAEEHTSELQSLAYL